MSAFLLLPLALGAAAAAAAPPAQTVAAERIAAAVRSALAERLREGHPHAQFELITRLADQRLPAGELELRVGEPGGRWPRARASLPVQLRVDGRTVRTLGVWVAVRDPRPVPTYAEAYPAHTGGERLRLVEATVDMSCCAGEALAADAAPAPRLRLKRKVAAGQPALAGDFETRPDVAARERVTIEVVRGPVRLQSQGMALGDGRVGDTVPVRPDASQQTVRSRVVAPQKVQIDG